MLRPAFLYANELNAAYQAIIYDPAYFFLIEDVWDYRIQIDESDSDRIQLVSLADGERIAGYFEIQCDRKTNQVTGLEVIRFNDKSLTFSRDFRQFILDLTGRFGFRKVVFEAIVGSPGEKVYDHYLEKYGARIVGVLKEHVRLQDGKYYDVKIYEILPQSDVLSRHTIKRDL